MPRLLYGTAWKAERTADLVLEAIRLGARGVDTAAQRKHYREELVGDALQRAEHQLGVAREDVWVQTKFTPISGQDTNDYVPYDASPSTSVRHQLRQSFWGSVRNLHRGARWDWRSVAAAESASLGREAASRAAEARRSHGLAQEGEQEGEQGGGGEEGSSASSPPNDATSEGAQRPKQRPWIDSYLLHSPLPTLEATVEAWEEMEELVLQGWIRGGIGFSNVYDPRIFAALRSSARRVRPTVLQNRWHHTTGHDVSLLSLLSPVLSPNDYPAAFLDGGGGGGASGGRGGVVYQGFWLLTGNARLLASAAVLDAAASHRLTPQQVVYRFVSQGMGVVGLRTAVLCGSTAPKHVAEAVEAVLGWTDVDDEATSGVGGKGKSREGAARESTDVAEVEEADRRRRRQRLSDEEMERIRREVYGE